MPSSLANAIFWVAVVACAVAQGFIVRGALRVAAAPQLEGRVPVARRRMEIAWAVLPVVALALVLAATWRAMHRRGPAAAAHEAPAHTARATAVAAVGE